jgi:cell division protein ZapB
MILSWGWKGLANGWVAALYPFIQNTFKNYCYQLTCQDFGFYSVAMDPEFKSLEQKINQVAEFCQRLRADNHQLRQELATARNENQRLGQKIESATSRLESLLNQLPEEDA